MSDSEQTRLARGRKSMRVRRFDTQALAADAAGVGESTIYRWEKGLPVGEAALRKIASALSVSVVEVLDPDAEPAPAETTP